MPPDLDIHVNNVHGSQMAAKITGHFTVDAEHRFRFTAIAFGRIGGQNVGVKLSDATAKKLEVLGYDPEQIVIGLQGRLLRGDMTIPSSLKRESFVDD